MAWGKAGSTTLTSTADVITVDSLSNNKCIMILNNVFSSGQGKLEPTLNNDTGSNYALRYALDGATEVTLTSEPDFVNTTGGFTNGLTFHVQYLVNISTEEKLLISHSCEVETTGTSGVPRLREYVGKWVNTSDTVSRYDVPNVGSGDFASGSNSTVLGSDLTPAAAVPFPTNVQVGSRAEITDTRKMYNYSDEVPSTSASTATTENDNGVNEQVMSSANFEFIGEKVVNTSSALYGLTVNKIGFMMKKREGSPTGTATACVMDSSANILYTFGTVDVSTLPTTYTWTYFTNTASTYTLTNGNYIGIKYNGGDVSNRIGVYWDNGANYDGTNSVGAEEASGSWDDRSTQDLRFKIFTGTALIPKQWQEIGI